jgi:hypothetical protein
MNDVSSIEHYEELMEFSTYVEVFWEKEYRKSMTRSFLKLFNIEISKDITPII